ncbi:MAG: proton-conducting transporter membrane subunit [Desulfovibrionales bacterium]|nr:proton-conducting transporter membrane subunit [Desulfovibrionales bacterium]
MTLALVLIPAAAALACFVIRYDALRRALLVATALAHLAMTAASWMKRPVPALGGWLAVDAGGLVFLSITSVLFLASALYALGYLKREPHGERKDFEEGVLFTNAPEAVFTGCLLFFLATMTLVTISQHFGLLWVAVEATTLASAPLIYFHRHDRSLEATWKYLLLCSVGIALALLGNFFLTVAASAPGGGSIPLVVADLMAQAGKLNVPWLKAAFVLLLIGYGTKMGLAPMHTWLPDAHSESPSLVSALLSGALLNCAFLGILRIQQVCSAAGIEAFGREAFIAFGLVSMAVAAVFIIAQTDFKRMLAYSSVEHMGILSLGVGLGGDGIFGAVFHAVNHSLTKGMLFLVAGNLLTVYATKSTARVRGILQLVPASGVLWVAGFLSITGAPPFGTFVSEFIILKAAFDKGYTAVAVTYLLLLSTIFAGMAAIVIRMAQGKAPEDQGPSRAEPLLALVPAAALGAFVLMLGLYLPPFLGRTLHEAAIMLGGS